ncbi:MAG: creatininase family protein [Alphaproteobacteria bacterium]|nr:creatininase family protein [Alphaproteobacteria bacterium]
MPGRPSPWIHELSFDEIEAHLKTSDVALVPIGATEQHGRHAPLLLDTGWAIAAAEEAAKLADCLVAPPMHYGWSFGHMAFAGAIGLRAETLTAVALEIGQCLLHHGFRRIIYVNGNRNANLPPLEIAANRLAITTGAFAAVADCGLIAREEVAALCDGPPGTIGHAGESETSLVLARYPHLVDMSRAPGGFREAGRGGLRHGHTNLDPRLDGNSVAVARVPGLFRAHTEARDGVVGDAQRASAEKGHAMVAAIARNLAGFIAEARKAEVTIRLPEMPV